jgi:transposase InsO family protein
MGYDAPSSQVVALALRHAMLPKQYGEEYQLHQQWGAYGKPEHLFTDCGKDFRSNHLQQISVQLGFMCHLRDRPSEGGIVERPFGTTRAFALKLETEKFSLEEAKASSSQIRKAGKTISNHSILEEVRDRDQFVSQKKTEKERQKEKQAQL